MSRSGIRPPAPDAFRAKCCDCLNNYADGRYVDCEICNCSFYARTKHRQLKPDFSWLFGKWTKSHEIKRFAQHLTEAEYINKYIVADNGKFNIGYPAMFRAKCFDCCANFSDGHIDCEICTCSIYYWMPYRKLIPDLNWLFDSPYTKHHRERARFEKLSRNEYIDKYIARPSSNEDEPDTDEEPQRIVRVRIVAP
jgi:hypothetical protein